MKVRHFRQAPIFITAVLRVGEKSKVLTLWNPFTIQQILSGIKQIKAERYRLFFTQH